MSDQTAAALLVVGFMVGLPLAIRGLAALADHLEPRKQSSSPPDGSSPPNKD